MTKQFTLGLDLDGVCGDYTGAFRAYVARQTGVREADLPDPQFWSLNQSWSVIRDSEHYFQLHLDAVRDGLFSDMPVMPGASQALWMLSENDVYIRVVTHRLLRKGMHQTAVADTVQWLDRAELPYRDLCFMGAKTEVGADVYIDDAPHNIESLQAAGNEVIIFDHLYNRGMEGPRARNWQEAGELILESKRRWDISNAPQPAAVTPPKVVLTSAPVAGRTPVLAGGQE